MPLVSKLKLFFFWLKILIFRKEMIFIIQNGWGMAECPLLIIYKKMDEA